MNLPDVKIELTPSIRCFSKVNIAICNKKRHYEMRTYHKRLDKDMEILK